MTKITSIMIYGICIYLLIILIMFIFQRSLLYLPSKEKLDTSYYSNTGLRKVELTTSDGLISLRGLSNSAFDIEIEMKKTIKNLNSICSFFNIL